MSQGPNIDGVLIQWGDRLFYPGNRVVKVKPQPKLAGGSGVQRAVVRVEFNRPDAIAEESVDSDAKEEE